MTTEEGLSAEGNTKGRVTGMARQLGDGRDFRLDLELDGTFKSDFIWTFSPPSRWLGGIQRSIDLLHLWALIIIGLLIYLVVR